MRSLLVRFATQSEKVTKDTYLRLCEQLGQEPDPTQMPLELSDFPVDVQVAFFMYNLLPDDRDFEGYWLGKRWESLEIIFNLYRIEDKRNTFDTMKLIEQVFRQVVEDRRKRDKEKEANKPSGGKKYTHKVRG